MLFAVVFTEAGTTQRSCDEEFKLNFLGEGSHKETPCDEAPSSIVISVSNGEYGSQWDPNGTPMGTH